MTVAAGPEAIKVMKRPRSNTPTTAPMAPPRTTALGRFEASVSRAAIPITGRVTRPRTFQTPLTITEVEMSRREKPQERHMPYVAATPAAPPPGSRLPTEELHTLRIKAFGCDKPGSEPVSMKVYSHSPQAMTASSCRAVMGPIWRSLSKTSTQVVPTKNGSPQTSRTTATPRPSSPWMTWRVLGFHRGRLESPSVVEAIIGLCALMATPQRRPGRSGHPAGGPGRRTTRGRRPRHTAVSYTHLRAHETRH